MGLKIVQNFGGSFTLNPETQSVLFELLNSPEFVHQVATAAQCHQVEFTELMFQPVPYSEQTPKGMPREFEPYHESEDYLIINVPPNFMFKAKIFNPSRICVVYRKLS
ncbi:hypothetical protein [Laspinema palackyanum]|uniref:hypothetical protein n=1 Tax=Laspinema palackyanum TaxID=3231601 RepID=UPI00345D1466|nr:hypothetical protein [Laspinema sp. D2c]